MKLDRNSTNPPRGKYALVKLRVKEPIKTSRAKPEWDTFIVAPDAMDFGDTPDTEFFVIRLKDKYASAALYAYAEAASPEDPEYAGEVLELAKRAQNHPKQRKPD